MFPVLVDISTSPVVLIGQGSAAIRRLALLDEARAGDVRVFSPEPDSEMVQAAGDRLQRHWPNEADVSAARLVFTAGHSE